MTTNELTKALAEYLRETILKNTELKDKTGESRRPEVFEGYLPPKRTRNKDDFPCLIVRATDGRDGAQGCQASVKIIVCTFDDGDDSQGHRDVANLVQRIRNGLMSTQIIGGCFRLVLPIEWTIFEEQPFPEWIGEIKTTWEGPSVMVPDLTEVE